MPSSVIAAVTAVGSFITAGAATGAVAATVGGAVVGAAVGGVVSAVSGGNVLKGALTGGLVGGLAGGLGSALSGGAGTAASSLAGESGALAGAAGRTAMQAVGDEFMADIVGNGISSSLVGDSVGSTLAGAAANNATGGLAGSLTNAMWTKAGIDAVGGMAKGYYANQAAEDEAERDKENRKVTWDASINPAAPTITKKDIATMTTPDKQSMSYRVFQGNTLDIPTPKVQQATAQTAKPAVPTVQKVVIG